MHGAHTIAAVVRGAVPCRGTWRTQEFKEYNFNALGQPTTGGHLHPLLKVRLVLQSP